MEIWTQKHAPKASSDIAGQNKPVREILSWLDSFSPGEGLLLTGPTGTGKTALVEAIARERGFTLLGMNASEKRTKAGIEAFVGTTQIRPLFEKGKLIVIDELDGISGRSDRGGVQAIVNLVKTSRFPVFLIALDPWNPKLRPLRSVTRNIKFTRTPVPSIAKRLREICEAEGITPEEGVLKTLASWSQGDIRSAIHDLQTAAEGKNTISHGDLEILGYRERGNTIHNILPTIFKSENIQAARKAMRECGLDSDDIFWWVEANISSVYTGEDMAAAFDALSKADVFRSMVSRQQNWRFKAYMSDLMASMSLRVQERRHGYIPWKAPDRLVLLGKTKFARAARKSLCSKIGELTHTSSRIANRDYLPYIKIMMKGGNTIRGLEIEGGESAIV